MESKLVGTFVIKRYTVDDNFFGFCPAKTANLSGNPPQFHVTWYQGEKPVIYKNAGLYEVFLLQDDQIDVKHTPPRKDQAPAAVENIESSVGCIDFRNPQEALRLRSPAKTSEQ